MQFNGFEIKISRHARRRIKLYCISEIDIFKSIEKYLAEESCDVGNYELVDNELANKYGLPVKICFTIKNGKITIITAYPLKIKKWGKS